jgi:hypothetical protein
LPAQSRIQPRLAASRKSAVDLHQARQTRIREGRASGRLFRERQSRHRLAQQRGPIEKAEGRDSKILSCFRVPAGREGRLPRVQLKLVEVVGQDRPSDGEENSRDPKAHLAYPFNKCRTIPPALQLDS